MYNTGTLTMSSCTISGNTSYADGGLNNRSTATLTNCTITGNTATSRILGGGGVSTNTLLQYGSTR